MVLVVFFLFFSFLFHFFFLYWDVLVYVPGGFPFSGEGG